MNPCKAIELALKDTLVKFAEVGAGVWIWGVQSITKDDAPEERFKAGKAFPMIRITATPEHAADNAWTFDQPAEIAIATRSPDDPFAQKRGEIYEAVSGVVKALYFQTLDDSITPHDELDYLTAQFSGYLDGGEINIGGMTLPGNPPPGTEDPQTMGINLVLSWSQTYPQTPAP